MKLTERAGVCQALVDGGCAGIAFVILAGLRKFTILGAWKCLLCCVARMTGAGVCNVCRVCCV